MPHHRLTTNRALRATGATAGALALLALPLAAPAVALTNVSGEIVESTADADLADVEEGVEDLAARVLEIAARAAEEAGAGEVAPLPGETEMEPAGSDYQPVAEPAPAPAPAAAPASQPAAAASEPPPPAASAPIAHDANGPAVPGWFSRTATAYEPVQAPVVAGPMTVPAPQFASAESLGALAGAARNGWTAVAAPLSAGLNPHTPTQWPIAVAAGMLLLVGGAHVLRLYDKSWKASVVTTTE